MRRDVLDAAVFLAGPALLHRRLFLRDRATAVPVGECLENLTRHPAEVASQNPEGTPKAVLRVKASAPSLAEADAHVETAWVGIADGAYRVQPLVRQTRLRHREKDFERVGWAGAEAQLPQVVWAGDGDSEPSGAARGSERAQMLTRLFGADVSEHVLQPDKDLSDGAFVFERLRSHFDKSCLCGAASSARGVLVVEVCGGTGGRRDHERASFEECLRFVAQCSVPLVFLLQPDTVLFNCPVMIEIEEDHCGFGLIAHGPERTGRSLCTAQPRGAGGEDSRSEQAVIHVSGARYGGSVTLQRPSHGTSNVITDHALELVPLQPGASTRGLVFELIITEAAGLQGQ